jgi:hypothetical protein
MNESAAGEVLLLRAYESAGFARWSDADKAAASRSALQQVGAQAPAEAFLQARAHAALPQLAPLDPLLPRWQALRPWRAAGLLAVIVLAFVIGVAVDHIGSGGRINLLAPPVWGVIAWNLAVYLVLLLRLLRPAAAPAGLRHALAAGIARWRRRALRDAEGGSGAVWQAFAVDWAACSAPLQSARAALTLHLGAAALALGVLAGMYLRGLVLDYRVGWESTFLDADAVHGLLSTLLAPASMLSGIALPDVDGVRALREPQLPGAPASAAPWIHLYALLLSLLVVLPRLALALWSALRVRALRRDLPLPLEQPYFQRLLRQQHGSLVTLAIWPHARALDAAALERLKALLRRVHGDDVLIQLEPTVAYGTEDEVSAPRADGAERIVLCELGATPEPESQGRLVRSLGARLLMLDEGAFAQRFGAASPRLAERRAAWSALAASLGGTALFVDLQAPDSTAAGVALQAAWPQEAA